MQKQTMEIQAQLAADLEAIYIGNLNTVDDDLILPLQGYHGSTFTWVSGEDRFITSEGKVHRPLYGMGSRKVVLTVTAKLSGETASREFIANVIQQVKRNEIVSVMDVYISKEDELPPVVIVCCKDSRRTTAPVVWERTNLSKNPVHMGHLSSADQSTVHVGLPSSADQNPAHAAYPENCILANAESPVYRGKVEGTDIPAIARIVSQTEAPLPTQKMHFLPINDIRLLPGTTYDEYQQRMLEYLRSVDDDSMLYNFRTACSLDTKGAAPMTGWDEAGCKLKGHTTGHYLSALALAWAATGEMLFRSKAEYMVRSLGECQEAFAASGNYHEGFLSAYSEEQFDLLEVYTKYPEIWAPYYTLDKIMSGLQDIYRMTGIREALEIESRMGDWVYHRLSRLPKEQLTRMWSMYIAGEYGGMLGTMVKLYELTGKEEHLQAARLFDNEKLFYPMACHVDTLEDMHANQHIPQIIGAMDMFRATGDGRSWKIGRNFWEIVTGVKLNPMPENALSQGSHADCVRNAGKTENTSSQGSRTDSAENTGEHADTSCHSSHTYCIGGVGETEMFHAANSTSSYLTDKAAESCASYNMLRLTGELFAYIPASCCSIR